MAAIKNAVSKISQDIVVKLNNLKDELKVGSFISPKYNRLLFLTVDSNKTKSFFQFSKVGEGGFGQCFLVTPTENAPERLARFGNFLVKKLKGSTDQQEIVKETAWMLLLTLLGHYGIVESHTVEWEVNGKMEKCPLVVIESDSSQNMTVYITMKYIKGRQLSEAIDELNGYDRLRIAVRIADTMNFVHSYKLAHCDLSCENIMLTQDTNDPILIDFGNTRTGDDFSILDTSSYHAMIYQMYRGCNKNEIPPVVRPIFDKWDDESHYQMSFKGLTDKYFEELSAYHGMVFVVDRATQRSNFVPVKRAGGLFSISIEAIDNSSSFTEYMEKEGISLAEQDEKIKKYLNKVAL